MVLVKASSAKGGYWIGEPHTSDGRPIENMTALAAHLDYNRYITLYLYEPGRPEKAKTPKLVNADYIDAWDEVGFADVIKRLPTRIPWRRHRARRSPK